MANVQSGSTPRVTIGLERLTASRPAILENARFGLLANQASVDREFRYSHDLLAGAFPGQLVALFSPQHGLWGADQDNMVETPHGRHERLRIPVHSLYAETRKPTREMLEGLDCLVVDLQDVGARVYTYIWTISLCLEACAEQGIPALVLDRPNPLGGRLVEGPRLDPAYASFVGRAAVPMRHGLTVAEMTRYLNSALGCGAQVEVVEMDGWGRDARFEDTGRVWVPPSPNLPRLEGVALYPGTVLFEGTNLSEGRGTTTPFEVVGAPFVDAARLLDAVSAWDLPGVTSRPLRFKPVFQKWWGRDCGGLFLHVLDFATFRPYRTALVLLGCARELWPDHFRWNPPPFEYEREKMPIDILAGSAAVRDSLTRGLTPRILERLTAIDEEEWWKQVAPFLLY